MKKKYRLEISVESLDAAAAAVRGGADRLELCANFRVGGVTPGAELMRVVRQRVRVPLFVMIRPRAGDFAFSQAEFASMQQQIEIAKKCGMDGVVLGILHSDSTVDSGRTRTLVECAHPLPVTFHRAFDETPDLSWALEDVIRTGAARILTSGGKPSAAEGAAVLASLVKAAGERITILPGGGINPSNLETVLRQAGAREFHSGLSTAVPYPRNNHEEFEGEVRKLAKILENMN